MDPAIAESLVQFEATVMQMRGHETPDQQVNDSNSEL